MKYSVAIGLVGSTLAASSPNAYADTLPTKNPDSLQFTAAAKHAIDTAVNTNKAYLGDRGFLRAADTAIQLLAGKDTFSCGQNETSTAEGPGPMYCPNQNPYGNDSIIVNAAFINRDMPERVKPITKNRRQRAAIIGAGVFFVVAHEFGHLRQRERNIAEHLPQNVYQPTKEPQADCFAGKAVRATNPTYVKSIELFLRQFPERDLAHGTPKQRIKAFKRGAQGKDCNTKAILKIRRSDS